jgi:hypothetical protein
MELNVLLEKLSLILVLAAMTAVAAHERIRMNAVVDIDRMETAPSWCIVA